MKKGVWPTAKAFVAMKRALRNATPIHSKAHIQKKLVHPACKWKADLLLPPALPMIQLEVMTKTKVIQLLVVYYFLAFGILFALVSLDKSESYVTAPSFSCTGDTCSSFNHTMMISPYCTSLSLVITSTSPLPLTMNEMDLVNITILNGDDVMQNYLLQAWTNESPTSVRSKSFDIDYSLIFGVVINLYSTIDVALNINGKLLIANPNDTLTLTWVHRYVSPSINMYSACIVGCIDVICLGYFTHRVYRFKKTQPHVKLPQWWWIQGLLLSLMMQIQVPFTIAQYIYTMCGTVMPLALLQVSFWCYVVGKNGCRFFVLCFADGMASMKPKRPRFYLTKASMVMLLTIVQGLAYELANSKKTTSQLVLLTTTLEFCTQGLMVLWYWTKEGQRIRSYPYKSFYFQYVTYGVMSFLVLPEAIGSLLTLLKRTTGTNLSSGVQSISWLTTVVRLQAFSWMVLQAYLPLSPHQLTDVQREDQELPFQIEEKDTNKFSLETAIMLLNASVIGYFDAHQSNSPSSCGRFGSHILHPEAYQQSIVRAFHDPRTDTNALLLHDQVKNCYILSFRGTGSLKNGFTDLKSHQMLFPQVDFKANKKELKRRYHRRNVYVHLGFFTAYQTLRMQIQQAVAELPRSLQVPLKIYCTGHSLGGALATICALDLTLAQEDIAVVMYNFGSPRVGNHSFQLLFNQKVPAFRVVNDGDVITQMPKRDFTGFSLEGVGIYKHVGTEVTLLAPGRNIDKTQAFRGIIVKPTIVDRVFVLELRTKLTSHSLEKYRRSFRSLIDHEPDFTDMSSLQDIDMKIQDTIVATKHQDSNPIV